MLKCRCVNKWTNKKQIVQAHTHANELGASMPYLWISIEIEQILLAGRTVDCQTDECTKRNDHKKTTTTIVNWTRQESKRNARGKLTTTRTLDTGLIQFAHIATFGFVLFLFPFCLTWIIEFNLFFGWIETTMTTVIPFKINETKMLHNWNNNNRRQAGRQTQVQT